MPPRTLVISHSPTSTTQDTIMYANVEDDPFSNHPPSPPPLSPSTRSDVPALVEPSLVDSTAMLKVPSSSIFVEHLEDATPSQEDMEAFDCFSPGSYISSRRQSVELAGYMHLHSTLSPTTDDDDAAYILLSHSEGLSKQSTVHSSPPLSPISSPHHYQSRSPRAYAHAHAAGMPFAALVRRLSYTSSRLPAKYSNRQYREQGNKRPKTSSGPLLSSPENQRFDAVMQDGTPIETADAEPSRIILESTRPVGHPQPSHGVTRPMTRRRTKSGEVAMESFSKSPARAKGKGHRRPVHPLRSMSFMDEMLLKPSSAHKRNAKVTESVTAPVSPAIMTSVETKAIPAITLPLQKEKEEKNIITPMTPDHEIEAQLAKHGIKRMSMPNLPTPPSTGQPNSIFQGKLKHNDMPVTDHHSNQQSPVSVGLRTPSPAPTPDGDNIVKITSRRSSTDERREGKVFTPGWPWNRRNSNSSLTSLLSPRLGKQVSPSLSPSVVIGHPPMSPSMHDNAAVVSHDITERSPSPNVLLRTSPSSQLSIPTLEAEEHESTTVPAAVIRGRAEATKSPRGTPRRSLSASFIHLGRKVASFGNNQAFDNVRQNSSLSSSTSSSEIKSTPVSKKRENGVSVHTPSPKTGGLKSRDWLWRSNSNQHVTALYSPSANSPLSTTSSPQDEVQWSFKVHEARNATSPSAVLPPELGEHKSLNGVRNHSPVNAKSPLGAAAVQADSYFELMANSETFPNSLSPASPLVLSPSHEEVAHTTAILAKQGEEEGTYLTMRTKSDLLSPERALVQQPSERSFVVESRPKLYRNARSDDGGLAARLSASAMADVNQGIRNLSTSAPASGNGNSSLMTDMPSPSRKVSPSPSRILTKIPEADEHDLQTRRESWLASLRGRPAVSNRRMSAADIFGLPTSASSNTAPLPESDKGKAGTHYSNAAVAAPATVQRGEAEAVAELDFSKKAIEPAGLSGEPSPSRLYGASSNPGTPQNESRAFRSRAVSQSSLLSASRPITPSASVSSPTGLTNIRHLPASTTAQTDTPQRQPHQHTQSLPIIPQLDPAVLHVSGLGAPESSVLNASHARFARVLSAAASQPPLAAASVSSPVREMQKTVGKEDKEKMRLLSPTFNKFEHAVGDDEELEASSAGIDTERDQVTSPELHRTPKLSYATSSSAGSLPSTGEPRTDIRARILDIGTPVRGGSALQLTDAHLTEELVFHRSSPSNRTSSSMSNANGPKNAFDILLSSRGLDSIDGLPQSRVASWARRDRSDDSEITITSNNSTDDGRPRDIFEEGRVSVW